MMETLNFIQISVPFLENYVSIYHHGGLIHCLHILPSYILTYLYFLSINVSLFVQESYLFIYRAMEAFVAEDNAPSADKDSGISNCNNYRGSLPPGVLPDLPPGAVIRSTSRNSAIRNDSPVNRTCTL